MDDDSHPDQEHALEGEGQGGGTGGTVGNEASADPQPVPHDPDAWDAKPADEEQPPASLTGDDAPLGARGSTGEDLGETEGSRSDHDRGEEAIPGARQPSTGDAVEGGAGRP